MFTEEQEIEALNESIKHWERMITFAKTRKGKEFVSDVEMFTVIGETWNSGSCPLCKLHLYGCSKCILRILYGNCDNLETSLTGTYENVWSEVSNANIWSDWIKNANVMVKQLTEARNILIKKLNKDEER